MISDQSKIRRKFHIIEYVDRRSSQASTASALSRILRTSILPNVLDDVAITISPFLGVVCLHILVQSTLSMQC